MNLQIFGQIPDFNKKISTVRSRGIALIPILQNIGQFKNRYPNDLWQEIIGNCDIRIGMGMTDVLIGVSTVETTSIRKSNSIEGEILEYGQKNISTLKRNLLNVDEILRIPSYKLLVNVRGNKPLLLDKMIYTEHSIFDKLKDSPITNFNPKWVKNRIEEKKIAENITENKEKKNEMSWETF